MTIIPPLGPYVPSYKPLTNISPFTYRDAATYLDKLEDIDKYLQVLREFVNTNFGGLGDEFADEVDRVIAELNGVIATVNANVDARLDANETAVDAAVADAGTAVANAIQAVNTLAAQVDAAVATVINDGVQVQDPVMAGILGDTGSQTRQLLDILFSPTAVSDSAIAGNIATPGTLTRNALETFTDNEFNTFAATLDDRVRDFVNNPTSDTATALAALFASKSTQTAVESGRLSASALNILIVDAFASYGFNARIGTEVTASGAARDAVDARVNTLRPFGRKKAWFPRMTLMGPGLVGIVDAWYYVFNGVLFWGFAFQASASNSQPWGTAPNFELPVLPKSPALGSLTGLSKIGGYGVMHSATAGSTHHADVIVPAASKSAMIRAGGSPHLVPSGTVPFTTGVLDALNFEGFYAIDGAEPRNFGAYGDSIVRFRQGDNNYTVPATWPWEVGRTDDLVFGGGFAIDGGTSAQVLAGAQANYPVDVCVIGVGVNDIAGAIAQATTVANILAIKAKVAAPKTIVLAVSPYTPNGSAVNALNTALSAAAGANGYTFIDPWAAYRQVNGTWTGGSSSDGTHPNPAPTTAAAAIIRAAVLA